MSAKLFAALIAVVLIISRANAFTVYDPANHAQNVLQAARALEQINNQIRTLQNQATMLQNMARQLQRLDYSSLGQITSALNRIDGLMIQADSIGFDLSGSDAAWQRTYPGIYRDADPAHLPFLLRLIAGGGKGLRSGTIRQASEGKISAAEYPTPAAGIATGG